MKHTQTSSKPVCLCKTKHCHKWKTLPQKEKQKFPLNLCDIYVMYIYTLCKRKIIWYFFIIFLWQVYLTQHNNLQFNPCKKEFILLNNRIFGGSYWGNWKISEHKLTFPSPWNSNYLPISTIFLKILNDHLRLFKVETRWWNQLWCGSSTFKFIFIEVK